MRFRVRHTVRIGDLVVAAFDEAARCSNDPREVSRLATSAVTHMLRRVQRISIPTPPRRSVPRWPSRS